MDNLREPWKEGESGNPSGRPKGSRNRSTIFREFLDTKAEDGLTYEQKLIKAVYEKSLEKGDVMALKEFMDSAHGKNTDKQELTGEGGKELFPKSVEIVVKK